MYLEPIKPRISKFLELDKKKKAEKIKEIDQNWGNFS